MKIPVGKTHSLHTIMYIVVGICYEVYQKINCNWYISI